VASLMVVLIAMLTRIADYVALLASSPRTRR